MSDDKKSSATTEKKHSGLIPYKPGQSGNPKGRPKGSRHKLGAAFIQAIHEDFMDHGKDVVVKVREEKPAEYLKMVASLQPKEITLVSNPLEDKTTDELTADARRIAREILAACADQSGTDGQEDLQSAPGVSTLQ